MNRIRRAAIAGATVIAGAGAVVVTAPSPAFANIGWGGTLSPGSVACVGQQANHQVRGEGTATMQGAKFFIYRNGVQAFTTGERVPAFVRELRSWYGNFPGSGYYTVCAKNTGNANTLANIRILTDGEI